MLSKLLSTAATTLLMIGVFALPASASDRDERSFTISVSIAPFAEAIAAQDAGAVGAWTIFNEGGGLLIETPKVQSGGSMTIHYGERNRLQIFSGGRRITPLGVKAGNGLTAARYDADDFASSGHWTTEAVLSGL